jgi:hypothetical protein
MHNICLYGRCLEQRLEKWLSDNESFICIVGVNAFALDSSRRVCFTLKRCRVGTKRESIGLRKRQFQAPLVGGARTTASVSAASWYDAMTPPHGRYRLPLRRPAPGCGVGSTKRDATCHRAGSAGFLTIRRCRCRAKR